MVKFFFYFFCFWSLGISLLEAIPFIDASIDSMNSQAHFPLQGTITITHSKNEKIDLQSFKMKGKPLEVSFVKDVNLSTSDDTWISIYHFQLPAQEKGLFVLPSIEVKINHQLYQTIPSTYEVKGETPPSTSSFVKEKEEIPEKPLIFRLEATVQGPNSLYPGERTKLFYRISYNRSVDLTRSELPMVHPNHFQKIGDVQIRDYQQQDITIQDLTQEVEAADLGTFHLGPSFIEGYAYSMKRGQKVYESTLLKSEAPIVTLEVKPFPKSEQPPSFTGALGQIKAEANLVSSPSVLVGDNLQIQISIQGVTNLSELHLPSLQCQPGFSGFFEMSDLPPLAEIKDQTKVFQVELRPLTTLIHQVPSIQLSSFDPLAEKYVIEQTSPLPLVVEESSHPSPLIPSKKEWSFLSSSDQWPVPQLPPLELSSEAIQINEEDIKTNRLNSLNILWLLPIGLSLLFLQKHLHDRWLKRPKPPIMQSEELLQRAFKTDAFKSLRSISILEEAFWHRLWEKNLLPYGNFNIHQLSQDKKLDFICSFLIELQALQYSPYQEFNSLQLKQKAQELFKSI